MLSRIILNSFGKTWYHCFHKTNQIMGSIIRAISTGYYTAGMKSVADNVVIRRPVGKIYGREHISLGKNVDIDTNSVITACEKLGGVIPSIEIGDNVVLGSDCHITACNRIKIEDGVLMGKKVTITDNSHGAIVSIEEMEIAPIHRPISSKGSVIIGKNVWISDKVTVCSGVSIGQGSIIGANSVVTHDIPPFSIAVGAPAKVIKTIK